MNLSALYYPPTAWPLESDDDISVDLVTDVPGGMEYHIHQNKELVILLRPGDVTDCDLWGAVNPPGLFLSLTSNRAATSEALRSFKLVGTFRAEKRSWDHYGGVSIVVPHAVYEPYSELVRDFHRRIRGEL